MSENEEKRRRSVCKIPHFERNNYYFGKLMTVRDYFAEQCYFNEKRWLINRMVHGWGVVCGLDVERIPVDAGKPLKVYRDDIVRVTKGLAIDCCGREILVCEEQDVKLIPEESECHKEKRDREQNENLVICIEYHECKSESLNIPPKGCDQKEKCEYNRLRDSFKIRVKYEKDVDLEETYGKFCPLEERIEYLKSWEEIQDDDVLKQFLIDNYNVKWVGDAEVVRSEDPETGTKNITISFGETEYLYLILNSENTKINLSISDGRTDEFIVLMEEDGLKIYKSSTVQGYLCKKLKKGCTECPKCPCLILARITRSAGLNPSILEFDPCYKRKLVYNNPLLYDLINCYHGDLPHITNINWPHGGEMDWKNFIELIGWKIEDVPIDKNGPGLEVTFDREVEGLNENTFIFSVIFYDTDTKFEHYWYIQGNVHYDNKKATFKVKKRWFKDIWAGSFIHGGALFQVILKGDHIVDKETNKALDANFIGGHLPSGNGTQGGNFTSWFTVKPNPNYEEEPEEME